MNNKRMTILMWITIAAVVIFTVLVSWLGYLISYTGIQNILIYGGAIEIIYGGLICWLVAELAKRK